MQLTFKNKQAYILTSFLFINILYYFSAHFSVSSNRLLPLYPFEVTLVQQKYYIWIYIFIQSFAYYTVSLDKDLSFIKNWIMSSFIYSILCFILFQFFPVVYHYQNSIALNQDLLTDRLLLSLRIYGKESASFPALFLGLIFISSYLKFFDKKKSGLVYLIFAILFSFSGIMIKQLYFSAIITSLLTTLLIVYLVKRVQVSRLKL